MSLEQIEIEIRRLSAPELMQLSRWLADFLMERSEHDHNWTESAEQRAELERRLAEFEANPEIATPFAPGYFDHLKKKLADERAAKTSSR